MLISLILLRQHQIMSVNITVFQTRQCERSLVKTTYLKNQHSFLSNYFHVIFIYIKVFNSIFSLNKQFLYLIMEVVTSEVALTATTARLAATAAGLVAALRTQLQFNYGLFAASASTAPTSTTTTATTTATAGLAAAAAAGLAVAFRTQLHFNYGLFAATTSTSAGGDIN